MTRHRPLIALVLGASVLAACAPATPDWSKPGTDSATASRDWAACRRMADARVGPRGSELADRPGYAHSTAASDPMLMVDRKRDAELFSRTMNGCMESKGYVRDRR